MASGLAKNRVVEPCYRYNTLLFAHELHRAGVERDRAPTLFPMNSESPTIGL